MNSPLSDAPTVKPYLTIRPTSGWSALNLHQLWLFRDLLFTLAQRDIKLRYKQTVLGVVWVVFQPLLGALLFSFFSNKLANISTGSIPAFPFAYAGMLGFNAFSGTLTKSSASLIGNAQLISKVFFPRLLLPLSTALSTLLDFAVSLCIMVLLMVIYHITPTWGLLLLPLWLALILMLSLGVGLIAAALTVSYRDVQYILPVLISFLPFACPIAFPASFVANKLPEVWQTIYFVFNPLASLLEAFRWSLTGSGSVLWGYVFYAAVLSIAVFLFGAFSFKKMERKFADVI
jgi:lipopolysaccharide transport system permease protein